MHLSIPKWQHTVFSGIHRIVIEVCSDVQHDILIHFSDKVHYKSCRKVELTLAVALHLFSSAYHKS